MNIVRKAWLALALSLAAPGLGHLYCGRPFKGIVLMLAAPFLAPLWMWVSFWQPSAFALAVLLLMTGGLLALYLYAFFDAYRLARREGRDYIRRPYNRVWVYGVFLLAGWAVPGFFSGQVRDHGFQAFYIPAQSMRPNLLQGDYVLANKRALRQRAPRLGEIVVLRDPANPDQLLVKRVVAAPGDRVAVLGGRVRLKGGGVAYHATGEDGLYEKLGAVEYRIEASEADGAPREVLVPRDHVYVLGDNRANSRDSRHFGPVRREALVGAVYYIYMPADFAWARWGMLAGG